MTSDAVKAVRYSQIFRFVQVHKLCKSLSKLFANLSPPVVLFFYTVQQIIFLANITVSSSDIKHILLTYAVNGVQSTYTLLNKLVKQGSQTGLIENPEITSFFCKLEQHTCGWLLFTSKK